MTEDTRRNKFDDNEDNYDFEEALTADERFYWLYIPYFHQTFLTEHTGWKWQLKRSLEFKSANNELPFIHGDYFDNKKYSTLTVSDISFLLFPFRFMDDSLFLQEISEALYFDANTPDEASKRTTRTWKETQMSSVLIPVTWLENQDSPYLKKCANVWQNYINLSKSSSFKDQKRLEKDSNNDVRQNTKLQKHFILEELPKYGINPLAVKKGEKAKFRRFFCAEYKISEAAFQDRWKELCAQNLVHSLHRPSKKTD